MTLVVGPSFSPTCLPSLGSFRRAALTRCHQCTACCTGICLSFFPGLLALSPLRPPCVHYVVEDAQLKTRSNAWHAFTWFTLLPLLQQRCRQMSVGGKCLLRCNADFYARKSGPRLEIRSLHFDMHWGVHTSHIVSFQYHGSSGAGRRSFHFRLKYAREVLN